MSILTAAAGIALSVLGVATGTILIVGLIVIGLALSGNAIGKRRATR